MNRFDEFLGGVLGTGFSAIGLAIQTNELLQTISLCITIAGGVMTLIVIPILNWARRSKKDGKITAEEIEEGIDLLAEGLNELNNNLKDKEDNKE